MTTEPLSVRAVTTLSELDAIRPLWHSLYAETDASPYCSFEWMRDALELIPRRKSASFCLCVLSDSSGTAGIVPLEILGGLFATELRILESGMPAYNTLLLTDRVRGRRPLLTACDWVRRHHRPWDYCHFEKVQHGSMLHDELEALIADPAGAAATHRESIGDNVRIALSPSWQEYAAGLSTAHRQNISRRTRALDKAGTVRFVRCGLEPGPPTADQERAVEDSLAICLRSWQGQDNAGRSICDDDMIEFFRASARSAAAVGQLDLSVLYLDDRPVSFIWGMARFPVANIAKLAFEPGLKASSPGLVHMARYLQDSIDRGFSAVEFGHEFADYKRRWSKVGHELFDYCYYAFPRWSRFRRRLQDQWQRSVQYRLQRWRLRRTARAHSAGAP